MSANAQPRPATAPRSLVEASALVRREIAREASARDLQRIIPVKEAALVRRHALQTARIPARYGGPEVSYVEFAQIMMNLGAGDPNLAQMLQPHFVLMEWLMLAGTEAQRQRFYGEVLDGAIITNAFAERGTKTPGDFATRLTRDGSGFRLDGVKFYSTGSLIADKFYVMALLDQANALAIVPKDRAGVEVIDDWDGMGQRTTASGTAKFDAVSVAADEVIPLPDWGKQRSYLGAASQIAHAAIDAGIAQAALEDAVEYARTKARPVWESGVDRATEDHYVIHSVGEMAVLVHAAEAMVLRSGVVLDRATRGFFDDNDLAGRENLFIQASIAVAEGKAASNEASIRLGEMIYRVAGASSTLRKYNLDRHWRNARTHTTHDPVSYKYRAIGDWLLNDRPPPISTKI